MRLCHLGIDGEKGFFWRARAARGVRRQTYGASEIEVADESDEEGGKAITSIEEEASRGRAYGRERRKATQFGNAGGCCCLFATPASIASEGQNGAL